MNHHHHHHHHHQERKKKLAKRLKSEVFRRSEKALQRRGWQLYGRERERSIMLRGIRAGLSIFTKKLQLRGASD